MPDNKTVTFDARFYLAAALDWIDAIPADLVDKLPAMPGFDRDGAEAALDTAPTPAAQSAGQEAVALTDVDIARIGMRFGLGNVGAKPAGIRETIGFARAILKAAAPVNGGERQYVDSTPHLHVGSSSFESWFQAQPFATQIGVKQIARDSYAAGMGDPLVVARADAQQVGSSPTQQQIEAAKEIFDHWLHVESKNCPDDEEMTDGEARHLTVRVLRAALTPPAKVGGDEREAMVATAEELESCALRAIEEAGEDAAPVSGGEREAFLKRLAETALATKGMAATAKEALPDVSGKLQKGDMRRINGRVWHCTDPDIDRWVSNECDNGIVDENGHPVERAADAQQVGDGKNNHPAWKRRILYTDTIEGQQTCRDDLWAITTNELKEAIFALDDSVVHITREHYDSMVQKSPAKVGGDEREAFIDKCIRLLEASRHAARVVGIEHIEAFPYLPEYNEAVDWLKENRAALSADGGDTKLLDWLIANDAMVYAREGLFSVAQPNRPGLTRGDICEDPREAIRSAIAANQAKGE